MEKIVIQVQNKEKANAGFARNPMTVEIEPLLM
jgi:hypothetical protein